MSHLPTDILDAIGRELEDKFYFLFEKLNVMNTKEIVSRYIKPVDVYLAAPGASENSVSHDNEDYGEGE